MYTHYCTASYFRLLQLVAMFMSMWLTAAGFVHLIENYGDPPLFDNNQEKALYYY